LDRPVTDDTVPIPGSVLVVCTANICRSPLAAALLADALPGADVSSAGVRAVVDAPMCPVSATALPDAPRAEHHARQLTPELVAGADLVLTMEREQRSAAVRLAPGSQSKVFTLREALALANGLAERGTPVPDDVAGLARAMHATRGLVPLPVAEPPKRRWWSRPVEPEDPLTIEDGHGHAEDEPRAAVGRVADTSERLLDALRALRGATVPPPAAAD
jgi:protein-tyrosine phosphatase